VAASETLLLLLFWLAASEMLCSAGSQCLPLPRCRSFSCFPSWNHSEEARVSSCFSQQGKNTVSEKSLTDLVGGALVRAVAAPELLVLLPDGLAPLHLLVLPRPQRLGHLCAQHQLD